MDDWAYLDKDHNVVVTGDKPIGYFRTPVKDRQVGLDRVGGYEVSTIFFERDQGEDGTPIWFETRTFGDGPLNHEFVRCATWDEAVANHQEAVKRASV